MRGRREVMLGLVIVGAVALNASAQQATAPAQPPPAPAQPVTLSQQAPAATPAARPRVAQHGFSVVLVVADLAATSGAPDDVPPAARRALTDMKDFLPYKSYKLLDAAWILGQGAGRTVTRLRGVDEQEYELRMDAAPGDPGRVNIRFTLADTLPPEVPVVPAAHEARVEMERAQAELMQLQQRLEEVRRTRQENHPEVRDLEKKIAELRREVEKSRTPKPAKTSGRAVVDTTFSMEVGETVVVGTSRLRGGNRALIALLTAVPPKGMRPEAR